SARLRTDGHPVQDADLAHLSPCRYEHFNPYGSTPSTSARTSAGPCFDRFVQGDHRLSDVLCPPATGRPVSPPNVRTPQRSASRSEAERSAPRSEALPAAKRPSASVPRSAQERIEDEHLELLVLATFAEFLDLLAIDAPNDVEQAEEHGLGVREVIHR